MNTEGEAWALHIQGEQLTYCDRSGARGLNLVTGRDQPATEAACPPLNEPNPSCSGLSLDVTVRSPGDEPNDIIDFETGSVPLTGRVHDCDAKGHVLAVATASAVLLLDGTAKGTRTLSAEGGERVAVGNGWVVWTQGSTVRAVRVAER